MKTLLKWREWLGLHKIYEQGYTTAKIKDNPYIAYLLNQGVLKNSPKNLKRIESTNEFRVYYMKHHLQKYNNYLRFLNDNDLYNPTSNYTEDDIGTLMIIKDNADGIKESKQTRRGLSAELFEDSKYIENHPGLEKAILKLLTLDDFPGQDPRDNQYIFVIPCKTPKAIILCENIHFLRMPWQAREYHIELWYAGGNNVAKLEHLSPISMPIYYSCDWDYDGLTIYERVKLYIPSIKLLYPAAIASAKDVHTQNHHSQWRSNAVFSGLDESLYTRDEKELIKRLIERNQWIEEENNKFDKLVEVNNLIDFCYAQTMDAREEMDFPS